jgi:hypothetical protein
MDAKYKKSLKIVSLLVISLLIAGASAEVYSYMNIEGSATISAAELSWALGTSAPAGTTIVGYTVTDLNFSVPQDTFKNYTDCLNIVNNDASNNYDFDLTTTVTAGDTSKFSTFDLVVYDPDTNIGLARLDILTEEGTASSLIITSSDTLAIRFEIDPATGETSYIFVLYGTIDIHSSITHPFFSFFLHIFLVT